MPPSPMGRAGKFPGAPRRGGALLPTVLIAGLLLFLFGIFSGFYTDWLWFRSVGRTDVYTKQLLTKLVLFLVGAALMAGAVTANFVLAYRSRPTYHPFSPEQQSLDRYRMAVEPFRRFVVLAAAALLGLIAGSSASGEWRTFLLWRNAVPFGDTDAQFGTDVSFYAFSLPWWRFVVGFTFAVVVLSLIAAAVTHYVYGGIRLQAAGERTTPAARIHLSVLLGIFVLLKAVSYWLDRYSLLIEDGRVGRTDFTGATYTDINAVLPAKSILAAIAVVCALLFFATIFTRSWLLPGVGVGMLLLSAVLVGGVWPAIVQGFQVRPSEQVKEADYISRNIAATRKAYDIADVEVIDYSAREEVEPSQLRPDADKLTGVRLLDPAVVSPTYQALQQVRSFYAFNDALDIDRYEVDGTTQDTVVAVREIDISRLPEQQRNWNNDHIVYTHGIGFVAARGNTRDDEGQPQFVERDIPPTKELGDYEPRVYFGERSPTYSIVGAPAGGEKQEFDYPAGGSGQENNTYDGTGGVPVGSFFNQLLYAMKFQEEKILLSTLVNEQSKILYVRNPRERVEKVAPWLELDGNPYPAVLGGKVVWILDGYTTSNGYPYSDREALGEATRDRITTTTGAVVALPQEEVNYIRNSVKATVDAYDGTVTLYAWDDADPVLKSWRKAFPGTVQDRSAISPELMDHLRYPEDLFKVQRTLLSKYHVTDPNAFYQGPDFWTTPDDPTREGEGDQPPYYLTTQMPGQKEPTFSLTTTFVPRERPNLSAFAAVSAEPGDDYGKIRVLQLPTNTAIPGPAQMQNQFTSDTGVATTINLLTGQRQTAVEYGNLLTLPFGGGLLYVEPVYVRAQGASSYPLLRKVLVSFGNQIAFEDTLPQALDSLFAGRAPTLPPGGTPGGTPGPTPGATATPTPGPSPTAGAGGPSLQQALADAQRAIDDADRALKAGDFAAYGEAQRRLQDAIGRAVAAQQAGGTPGPRPPATARPAPATARPAPTTSP